MSQRMILSRSRQVAGVLGVACLLLSLHSVARSQEPENKSVKESDGFAPLFNGKDLSGWQTTGNWVYEPGGVLALKPTSRRRRLIPDYQSFLWSKATYD